MSSEWKGKWTGAEKKKRNIKSLISRQMIPKELAPGIGLSASAVSVDNGSGALKGTLFTRSEAPCVPVTAKIHWKAALSWALSVPCYMLHPELYEQACNGEEDIA